GPSGILTTGLVPDGEVEDHVINLLQDLTVDLTAATSGAHISVRKSQDGTNVEVVDTTHNTTLGASPLSLTHAIIVHGSATQSDEIVVDYAFGGYFSLPAGVHLDGGASSGDSLTIKGATGGTTSALYISQGQSLGNATVQTTDGGQQNIIQFT